jgi:hypothetical protein
MSPLTFLAAALASASLAACDMPASGGRTAAVQVVSAGDSAHRWTVHEDGAYGYAPEKGQRGPAAPAATFRYLGLVDGEYQIGVDDASGTIAACAHPCAVIRYVQEGETIRRVAFDPQSAIGAAFTDAFNGKLEVYQLPPPDMEQAALSTPAASEPAPPLAPGEEPPPDSQGPSPTADQPSSVDR